MAAVLNEPIVAGGGGGSAREVELDDIPDRRSRKRQVARTCVRAEIATRIYVTATITKARPVIV